MRLGELITEISLLIAEKHPWVEITPTLHGLLHHSSELIHLNGGWSLGTLSEALERINKYVRRYLEQYAWTSSPILQLTDAVLTLLKEN